MITIEEQLKQLVIETCQHPPRSVLRQKGLTALVRLIYSSKKLWRDNSLHYEEALQRTWEHFCLNLCEAGKPKSSVYDSNRASVITWINNHLKWRLKEVYDEIKKDGENTDPNGERDPIPAPPQVSDLLEQVRQWVEVDKAKVLRRTHIRDRPDANAQVLILRRLPPETSWQVLSEEFALPVSTLSSFHQRKCILLLKEFNEM